MTVYVVTRSSAYDGPSVILGVAEEVDGAKALADHDRRDRARFGGAAREAVEAGPIGWRADFDGSLCGIERVSGDEWYSIDPVKPVVAGTDAVETVTWCGDRNGYASEDCADGHLHYDVEVAYPSGKVLTLPEEQASRFAAIERRRETAQRVYRTRGPG